MFVGYPQNKKGFKVYDLETKRFYFSRDVHFHETFFPFKIPSSTSSSTLSSTLTPNTPSPVLDNDDQCVDSLSNSGPEVHNFDATLSSSPNHELSTTNNRVEEI